jgi:hypothetical protein
MIFSTSTSTKTNTSTQKTTCTSTSTAIFRSKKPRFSALAKDFQYTRTRFPAKSIANEPEPTHPTLSLETNMYRVCTGGGVAGAVEWIATGIVVKTVSGTVKGVKSDKLYPRNTKTCPGANLSIKNTGRTYLLKNYSAISTSGVISAE